MFSTYCAESLNNIFEICWDYGTPRRYLYYKIRVFPRGHTLCKKTTTQHYIKYYLTQYKNIDKNLCNKKIDIVNI